jgi:GT2 family glycosyltransferase
MSENRLDIDFAYPVSYDYAHAHPKDIHGINLHGFLIDKDSLLGLGEFDENVSTLLLSVDFNMRARSKDLDVRMDPKTILSYEPPSSFKSSDSRLFHRQWEREFAKNSFAYLQTKWSLRLDEPKYMEWLEKKLVSIHKKPSLTALHPALKPHGALLGLQKLLQDLARA